MRLDQTIQAVIKLLQKSLEWSESKKADMLYRLGHLLPETVLSVDSPQLSYPELLREVERYHQIIQKMCDEQDLAELITEAGFVPEP